MESKSLDCVQPTQIKLCETLSSLPISIRKGAVLTWGKSTGNCVVFQKSGGIAQMVRAPALQAGGPGFESPCLHDFESAGGIKVRIRAWRRARGWGLSRRVNIKAGRGILFVLLLVLVSGIAYTEEGVEERDNIFAYTLGMGSGVVYERALGADFSLRFEAQATNLFSDSGKTGTFFGIAGRLYLDKDKKGSLRGFYVAMPLGLQAHNTTGAGAVYGLGSGAGFGYQWMFWDNRVILNLNMYASMTYYFSDVGSLPGGSLAIGDRFVIYPIAYAGLGFAF